MSVRKCSGLGFIGCSFDIDSDFKTCFFFFLLLVFWVIVLICHVSLISFIKKLWMSNNWYIILWLRKEIFELLSQTWLILNTAQMISPVWKRIIYLSREKNWQCLHHFQHIFSSFTNDSFFFVFFFFFGYCCGNGYTHLKPVNNLNEKALKSRKC